MEILVSGSRLLVSGSPFPVPHIRRNGALPKFSYTYLTFRHRIWYIYVCLLKEKNMNKQLTDYFRLHHTIDIPTAQTIGISRAMLSYLVKTGELQRAAQGLYMSAMEIADDLVTISSRSPTIVFSHETALALHKLHNRIPAIPSITLPSCKRVPHSLENSVSVYHVKKEFHNLGIVEISSFLGNPIQCYDKERTICDIVRSRRRLDEETYVNAIRTYSLLPEKDLPRLFEYAEKMDLSKKMHRALEVIL
jgi:predicted transcriptional regulator of viral defense system